ncbi:MFS transporter [Nocardioides jensenii]|uniref:MFS transporter n=1 Tax=Nocardioides jensenii TaxID=1843 RepID=UPI0009EB352E|nr:MFS transporter [Nocardioides jensenii]
MTRTVSPSSRRTRRRVLLSSYLGSTIEFYDFLLYGLVATLVFGEVFFSGLDPTTGRILALATLAAGYVARPVGGVVFGHFGDRFGRKSTLVVTMSLMGLASCLVGLLPTYASIGVAAPILLTLLRVVQGIAVGGEWGGAALMALEHSEDDKRGFAASFANMGGPSGAVLATVSVALFSLLPESAFLSWGWRLPFLLSFVLVGIGLFIRLQVTESPLFLEAQEKAATTTTEKKRTPLAEVLRSHPHHVLLALAAGLAAFLLQSLLATFAIGYAIGEGHSRGAALTAAAIAAFVHIFTIPAFALLSDRVGRRPVMIGGALATAVLAWPLFALLSSGNWWLLLAGFVLGNPILQAAMYGPLAAFVTEMFGTRARYTGASLGYQLSTTVGAGFGPVVAASLLASGGGRPTYVVLLVIGTALASAVAVWLTKESSTARLGQSDKPAAAPAPEPRHAGSSAGSSAGSVAEPVTSLS